MTDRVKAKTPPEVDLSALGAKWPSAIVSREKVGEFSGGVLNPKTMANLDCQGLGPDRVKIGRKNAYPVPALIDWMRARMK
ncbi:MAG: hypothetical protein NTV58_15105 [Deltaproteobacteria bacterium]|nr:hypothetical protein [Deltaproteobacteria bacterium]